MPPRIRRRITSAKREQIEEEQKRLEKSIVRPFDVLNGLPVSYGPPPVGHYEDVLKNPLTMKDSGVFYRSLLKSRYNYVNICPMFRLYWVKQSSYAKKLAAIDKPLPKSAKDDTSLSSHDRVPVLGMDVSARDVMVKLCDAGLTIGPHEFEIRLFIVKDERSDKPKKDTRSPFSLNLHDSNSTSTNQPSNSTSESNHQNDQAPVNSAQAPPNSSQNPMQSTPISNSTKINTTAVTVEKPGVSSGPAGDDKSQTNADDGKELEAKVDEQKLPSKNKGKKTNKSKEKVECLSSKEDLNKNTKDLNKTGSLESSKTITHSSTTPATASTLINKSSSIPQQPAPPPPPAAQPPAPHPDPHNMQSIENTIMISNLNTIARTDESLNQLMKEVALGKASQEQILKFQGYIKRAREMGPQPHHAYLFANQPIDYKYGKFAKDRKPMKEKKPKEIIPKNQKLTAFQERYSQDATLLFEFVENPNVRFMLPKTAICEVLPPSTMINAEDGDKSDNSDILVSFIWVHNQKEIDTYNEKLTKYENAMKEREEEAKKLEEHKNKEATGVEEETAHGTVETTVCNEENNISELVELEDSSAKANEENAEKEKEETNVEDADLTAETNDLSNSKEAAISTDTDAKTATADDEAGATEIKIENQEASTVQKRIPPRRVKKKKAPPRRAAKKLEPPVQPEIRFTTLSFTIHGVPKRFVPIVVNSFEPYEQAKSKMKHILETGFRTTSFYLWYQIDGKLDEKLAEEIRTQLVQEEKKLTGVVNSVKEIKKRPKKPKPENASKRVKVEDLKVNNSNDSSDPKIDKVNDQQMQPTRTMNSIPANGP